MHSGRALEVHLDYVILNETITILPAEPVRYTLNLFLYHDQSQLNIHLILIFSKCCSAESVILHYQECL